MFISFTTANYYLEFESCFNRNSIVKHGKILKVRSIIHQKSMLLEFCWRISIQCRYQKPTATACFVWSEDVHLLRIHDWWKPQMCALSHPPDVIHSQLSTELLEYSVFYCIHSLSDLLDLSLSFLHLLFYLSHSRLTNMIPTLNQYMHIQSILEQEI